MSDYPPKVRNAAATLAHYLKMSHPDGFFNENSQAEMEGIVFDLYDALREETERDFLSIQGNLNP